MMKKLFFGLAALIALTFTACEDDDAPQMKTVTFEDITLDSMGYNKGADGTGFILSEGVNFSNGYENTYQSWSGFSVSNNIDTVTAGYLNQFSTIAAKGAAGSDNFAVYYYSAYANRTDSIKFDNSVDMESLMLCNNTYAYLAMKDGNDGYNNPPKYAANDYFKLTITCFDITNTLLGSTDFYLADFRNGKSSIIKEWTKVDLSTFKNVSHIKFSIEFTGSFTPTYFCLDNIAYYTSK